MNTIQGLHIQDAICPQTIGDFFAIAQNQSLAFVEIIPSVAKELLENHNFTNRPISKAAAQKYKLDMENGVWTQGVSTIILSEVDSILDGQHRLQAVVEANTPIVFSVKFNAPKDSFAVLDTGKKRTARDTLSVNGYKNCSTLASMIRRFNHYKLKNGNMWNINSACSNQETLNHTQQYVEFQEIASQVDANKNLSLYANKSDLAACYAIFYQIDPVKAKAFMDLLTSTSSVYEGIDFQVLFNSLRMTLTRNKTTIVNGKKTDPHDAESRTYWYMFDAWNAFILKNNVRETSKKVNRETFVVVSKGK